ncbi:uncharacterized protein PHACADRAFT_255765 [Phanerochaete carnosa HHB-10118-sp]|uniref:Uncharacterized protein n=1 Tax=Phanerochaete carnosa (strain HHB-10118-sp) TaxID=650164 RepID=K5W8H4_PHACS|nr:uncharacterized protein PHACADRAFT_255765 [Phanerochaete carnosa HHB-10118-sp]EKM55269.1 hypothetical protein PHACADRAFT_255765 [Phanerochaete carnosa HHB-10118-sp]
MKRARRRIDSEEPPKKKQKTYSRAGSNGKDAGQRTTDNPFREALRRSVTDVCDQGIKEGFIKLIVALKPVEHSGTLRVVGDVIENGDLVRFEVAFLKTCIRLLAEASVGFDMNDEVLISLKDVHLEPKEVARGGKSVKFLPMTLTFSKGVCLKFVYKKGSSLPGKLLDLWAG